MDTCRNILPLLEWLAADELAGDQRRRVEAHVRECPACRRELAAWRSLLAASAQPAAGAAAELQAIDWQTVSARIMAGAAARTDRGRHRTPIFSMTLAAAAAVLILAVGTGVFFWTRARGGPLSPVGDNLRSGDLQGRLSAATVKRLQSGLAREEVVAYLQQSQLMLTDLLKDCAGEEVAPWEIRLYSRQAKELLLKKKYCQQNLPAADWLRVRNISERIDWLNYEILQLEDRQLCSQIGRLQQIMENEKLLLKIRLLEKDLSSQPYQEV
jgi:hypothetical protein